EHDDDLPHALAKRRFERAQRRRIGLIPDTEDVEHRCSDVDESASVVVREYKAARAETVDKRVWHRRTILPGRVRRVFEVEGLFDGARTRTNAAILIYGGEV